MLPNTGISEDKKYECMTLHGTVDYRFKEKYFYYVQL